MQRPCSQSAMIYATLADGEPYLIAYNSNNLCLNNHGPRPGHTAISDGSCVRALAAARTPTG
jgi:hypothetical protein